MSRAPINVHIERLLVDGVPGMDRVQLGDAVSRELKRLLSDTQPELSNTLTSRIDAGTIRALPGQTMALGEHIARATMRALGGKP